VALRHIIHELAQSLLHATPTYTQSLELAAILPPSIYVGFALLSSLGFVMVNRLNRINITPSLLYSGTPNFNAHTERKKALFMQALWFTCGLRIVGYL